VYGEVAHPLNVRSGTQGGRHDAKVACDWSLARHEFQDYFVDLELVAIDAQVVGNDLLGALEVGHEEGVGGHAYLVAGFAGHPHQAPGDMFELLAVELAHSHSCGVVFDCG
jgi:hypothetical protein